MADAAPGAEPAAALTMRGIIGVMGGLVLYMVITEVLETALVAATSEVRPTDVASYYAARNRPADSRRQAGLQHADGAAGPAT